MKKTLLGVMLLAGATATAHAFIEIDGMSAGFSLDRPTELVYCEVGEERLLAENNAACEEAGGRVTHRIESDIVEVTDGE